MNIFVTTQMRTGSTWLCDLLSESLGVSWSFWERGKYIQKEQFEKQIKYGSKRKTNLFKIHYTPPERICECITQGDTNNFVISITRDLRDVAISKIFYIRYNAPMRNITRLQSLENMRKDFGNSNLDDKTYVNEFLKTPHANHIIENWKMYNNGFTHPNYMLITYEELNKRRAHTLRKALRFLGIQKNTRQIRRIVVRNNFKHKTGRKEGTGSNQSFRRKGIIGDHENYLNEENTNKLNKIMEEYKYSVTKPEPKKVVSASENNHGIEHLKTPLIRKKIIVFDEVKGRYIINRRVFRRI